MSKWQPIETAPKDGTRILLWVRSGLAISGCWHKDPGRDDPYVREAAWSWWVTDEDVYMFYDGEEPLFWMPLELPEGNW